MSKSAGSGSRAAELLATAQAEGTLSPEAAAAINVEDIGEQIQAGFGVDVSDVKSSQVTLVMMMPDDSGSIRFSGRTQDVRDGHNLVLDALSGSGSKKREGILLYCRYLNGNQLYPFVPLDQAVRMDTHNYDPGLGTPLYDETIVMLAAAVAKVQAFEGDGVPCRAVILIITDGADEHSPKVRGGRGTTAENCREVITSMLGTENYIIAGMGINNGTTDFRQVFLEMGIEDRWIFVAGDPSQTEEENKRAIRHAFNLFSQTSERASQGGASFTQTSAGGFGAP